MSERIEVAPQLLFAFTIKIQKHDPISKLRMGRHNPAAHHNACLVQPQLGLNLCADRKRHDGLDVAAIAADVTRFDSQGNIAAFDVELQGKMNGMARVAAAFLRGSSPCKVRLCRMSSLITHGHLIGRQP